MQFSTLLQSTLVALSMTAMVQAESFAMPYCNSCDDNNCGTTDKTTFVPTSSIKPVANSWNTTYKAQDEKVLISTSTISPAMMLDNRVDYDAVVRFTYKSEVSGDRKMYYPITKNGQCIITGAPRGFISDDMDKIEVYVDAKLD
jgi:hypothetical protein